MDEAIDLEYAEHSPGAPASMWVRCIWTLRAPAGLIGEAQPILPDGCMEVVYNLADPFRRTLAEGRVVKQHGVIVVGPQTRHVIVEPTGQVDLLGIRFHPWSGGMISREPLSALRDQTPDESIVGTLLPRDLRDRLQTTTVFAERVNIVERALSGPLAGLGRPFPGLVAALTRLEQTREPESIRTLARTLGTTQRTMQRQFESMVGVSPKLYARIARMQRAIGHRMRDNSCSWSRAAQMAGYYDHAHMVHDFSDLAGFPPSTFDQEERQLTENFIS